MTQLNGITQASFAILIGLAACDSNKEPVTEGKKEAKAALAEHSQNVEAASKQDTAEDKAEALRAANERLAKDLAAAKAGVSDKPAMDKDAAELSPDKRFTVLDKETKEEFVKRANDKLKALDAELAAVKTKNVSPEDTRAVEEKLAEARKDLNEVTNGSPDVIDDGKLGVTVAINSARRKIDRIQEDLAKSQ